MPQASSAAGIALSGRNSHTPEARFNVDRTTIGACKEPIVGEPSLLPDRPQRTARINLLDEELKAGGFAGRMQ